MRYAFLIVFLASVLGAWFFYIRPKLVAYRYTAGLMARIEAGERGLGATVLLHLRGLKTVLMSLFVSGIAAAKAAIDGTVATVGGIQQTDLDPLKSSDLWHAFFSDKTVLQILSFLGIATAMLAIRGHLRAAQVVPQPLPPAAGGQ